MKILVNGASGQLGREVVNLLSPIHSVHGFSSDKWNVADGAQTRDIVTRERPDVVIHCAAYTNVDQAEDDPVAAFRVNAYGARNVAAVCSESDTVMVYVSTDYVFDGEREDGYDEWDRTAPFSVYGRSKEAGEQFVRQFCSKHFIVRTSWLYGVHGSNFFKTIVKKAQTETRIPVVNDQTGSPTYTGHLVDKIDELIRTQNYGTFHAANSGSCTWFQFARTIVEQMSLNTCIVPITSRELARKAKRPRYSTLRSVSLPAHNMSLLPHWQEGVRAFIDKWNGGKARD